MIKILKNPVVLLLSIAAGIFAGFRFRDFSLSIAYIGDIFLLMMKMCVIPILVASIVSSFGRLVGSKNKNLTLIKIFSIFLVAFVCIGLISFLFVSALKPGQLSIEEQKVVGSLLHESEEGYIEEVNENYNGVEKVVAMIIPDNIFKSLAEGESIQILVFSALFGIAAGLLKSKGEIVIKLADASFAVCIDILNWIMLLLPFGLFAMLATQIAQTGLDVIMALTRYISCIYYISVAIIVINAIIIATQTNVKPHRVFMKLRNPMFVAFGTRSTLTSIPACIKALRENFKISSDVINLIIPISSILARFSMMILYISVSVFAIQLYGIDVSYAQLLQVFGLCVVFAVAGAGTPTIISLSMLSVIFTPISIPYSTIVVLLLAIIPIIDPVLTMANVQTNCLITIVIDRMEAKRMEREKKGKA